jgi:hypothetical protein
MLKVVEFMNRHRASGGLMIAALLLAPACAAEQDTTPGADAPIAQVALDSGVTVSFYEPRPGTIAISGDAPAGMPELQRGRTAVELYTSLAPGRAAPEALVAAQQRADAARAGRPHPAPAANVGPVTTQSYIDNKTEDDEAFVNNHCGGAYDVIQCRINRTTGTSSQEDSIDYAIYWVCADVGNVTQRMLIDGEPWHSADVLEGHCHWFSWDSGLFNDGAYGDVVNVSGSDRYHFSARYNF